MVDLAQMVSDVNRGRGGRCHQVVYADQNVVLGVPADDPAAPMSADERLRGRVHLDVGLAELYDLAAEWADDDFPEGQEIVEDAAAEAADDPEYAADTVAEAYADPW